jgi:hypothetical protein
VRRAAAQGDVAAVAAARQRLVGLGAGVEDATRLEALEKALSGLRAHARDEQQALRDRIERARRELAAARGAPVQP